MKAKYTFPSKDILLSQLLSVEDTLSSLQEDFYPHLVTMAGKELTANDILSTIEQATLLWAENTPVTAKGFMAATLLQLTPRFVDAIVLNVRIADSVKMGLQKVFHKMLL